MSRIKHLTMLIMKVVFIVLAFVIAAVFTALQSHSTDKIMVGDGITENDILIYDEDFEKTGASVSVELSNGDIIFDIVQSGERYDDIRVNILCQPAEYNTAYLSEMLGDRTGKEKEYYDAMEKGPWLCNFHYSLKSDKMLSTDRAGFVFTDPDGNEYDESVFVKMANKSKMTDDFKVNKDERVAIELVFGSPTLGALPSGRYTLTADLNVKGLYEGTVEAPKLNPFQAIGTFFRVCGYAIRNTGWGIFAPTSWLTFYGIVLLLGWFMYLYRDVRVVISVFLAVLSDDWSGAGTIMYTVYKNGVRVGTYADDTGNFAKVAIALIVAMLAWVVLTVTIPLRILWYLIRDIIYLIKDDDEALDEFSYLGNLLGGIGIYIAMFGFAGVMGAGVVIGVISLVIGVGLIIFGTKLCRDCEDYI